MELFKELTLLETQKQAHREILYAIRSINQTYNEWKKRGKSRRKNAVAINTTSVNKLTTISPESIDYITQEMKEKISIIIMRCLSLPHWKAVESKKASYRKLYPYIIKLENVVPHTGTKGNLKEIIMTRFSAAVCKQSKYPQVFVAYEPVLPNEYLKYLFGDEDFPEKTYKMEALPLPDDFDDLIDIIKINHEKGIKLYLRKSPTSYK
jgi:hypothetical protein